MLKIEIEKLYGGWLHLIMGNGQKQHNLHLSTVEIYFPIENFFNSVINLLENNEEHLKLDEEETHYFLFLIKENEETLKYFLCNPQYGDYDDYYVYLTDTKTEPYIRKFKWEEDVELEYIVEGKCSLQEYYLTIYHLFKNILHKHGLDTFKELAMSDFPIEEFQEMERLLIEKAFIKI